METQTQEQMPVDVYTVVVMTENGPQMGGVYTDGEQVREVVQLLRRYHALGYLRSDVTGIEVKIVDVAGAITEALRGTA